MSYLILAHVPDNDGNSPRQTGDEPTTMLLRQSYLWLDHAPWSPEHNRTEELSTSQLNSHAHNDNPFDEENSASLERAILDEIKLSDFIGTHMPVVSGDFPNLAGFEIFLADKKKRFHFFQIGHVVLGMIMAWIAAHGLVLIVRLARPEKIDSSTN